VGGGGPAVLRGADVAAKEIVVIMISQGME